VGCNGRPLKVHCTNITYSAVLVFHNSRQNNQQHRIHVELAANPLSTIQMFQFTYVYI